MDRTVYILLSRSGTSISRLIHFFIGGDYTHASIGLDGPEGVFYSFARKYPQFPLPGGLIQERGDRGYFFLHPQTPCCLYEMPVTEEIYGKIRARIEEMWAVQERYHYSVLGAIACYFRIPVARPRHYFCSHFVAEVLTECGAANLPYAPGAVHPMDFLTLENLRKVHQGVVGDLEGLAEAKSEKI